MRAFCLCLILVVATAMAEESPRDYSKEIVGCWLGSRKFEVYHADGRWGVKRNEEAAEDIRGRRWRVAGNKLFLTYPGDHGLQTTAFTIVLLTKNKLVLEADGYREELTRYSSDCHREA